MSGSTTNTNILNAINEVIKALNDLTLTCSPTVNVSSSAPSVVVNCSCGGGGSTTSDPPFIPPDVNPIEGGTPPSGFEQPTEIDSRKCKAANYLYDGTLEVLTKFSVYGVEDYINLGIGYLITMIAFLISALAALGGAIGSFAAYLSGIGGGSVIASTLSAQGTSISALITVWEEKHNEIVCALYNATAARPAIDAVSDVLSNAGLSSVNVAVFKAIFTVEVATILFFKPAMKGVTIEQDLDGYEVTVSCTACGAIVAMTIGTQDSGDLAEAGRFTSTLASAFGGNRQSVVLNSVGSGGVDITVTLVDGGGGGSYWVDWYDTSSVYHYNDWSSSPNCSISDVSAFSIRGNVDNSADTFTVDLTYVVAS